MMYATLLRLPCTTCALLLAVCCFFCSPAVAGTNLYTYDDLNRLVRVQYANGSIIKYTYDATGNRLTRTTYAVSLTGRVTDTLGNPLADICVNVFSTRCGTSLGAYPTDTDGIYSVNLPAGTYYLSTDVSCGGNNLPSYFVDSNWTSGGGVLDCNAAEAVTVTDGQSTDHIDFALVRGGAVAGTLYKDNGTTPITGVTDLGVAFYTGDPCSNPALTGWTSVDAATGHYRSPNLPAGDYYLKTYTNATAYGMEWWAAPLSRTDCSAAQPVTVAEGQTSADKDFQLVLQIDSDGDGLYDTLEDAGCTDSHDADSDDDGIPDGVEDANHNGQVDIGETDPCNADTDGDGIQDGTELGLTLASIGLATDQSVFIPDLDPTSTTNPLSADTDGDGLTDGQEDANHNGRVDAGETDPLDSHNKKKSSFFIIKGKNGTTIIIKL